MQPFPGSREPCRLRLTLSRPVSDLSHFLPGQVVARLQRCVSSLALSVELHRSRGSFSVRR